MFKFIQLKDLKMKQFLLFLFLPLICFAQNETIFQGVKLGQTVAEVKSRIEISSAKLNTIEVEDPVFPLSKESEVHLICLECQSTNGLIEEVAFTFADDRLSLIQASGNAVKAITGKRKDSAQVFMKYVVYWEDLLVADLNEDKVWLMTEEAAHPSLYAWDNPYLPSVGGKTPQYVSSAEIPDFIEMGGDLDKLTPLLEEASDFTFTRELGPDDPNAQLQIDCFGIEYAGFPRKFEARFGDGKLNTVWILTAKGEEDRIRKGLTAVYGDPIFTNEAWEVFQNWQVFLRKDKPEVLLLTPELGMFYKKDYFKQ